MVLVPSMLLLWRWFRLSRLLRSCVLHGGSRRHILSLRWRGELWLGRLRVGCGLHMSSLRNILRRWSRVCMGWSMCLCANPEWIVWLGGFLNVSRPKWVASLRRRRGSL